MKTQVIVVAAGSGTRFKSTVPKPFVLLKSKPLIAYSLDVFERSPLIDAVIIVGHKDNLNRFEALQRKYKKIKVVVAGGKTRADSVKCGIKVLDRDADIVLVHDAARPFVNEEMIVRLLGALDKYKAAITAVPLKPTIKLVDPKTQTVKETLRRDLLWEVQTPQGFHKHTLVKAHAKKLKAEATDDAILVERMGIKVKVVMGSYQNIKVTTPEDLDIGRALLKI